MSCHKIEYRDGAKYMVAVSSVEEYTSLRDSAQQQALLRQVREGNKSAKMRLLQMNYSCMPNVDGTLKGATVQSNSVGMDVDHLTQDELQSAIGRILEKKEELGLLLMERSARGEGLHIVFRRRGGKTQVENLRWAAAVCGVEYDDGAKDITRVFFSTTAKADELLYVSEELFINEPSGCQLSDEPTPEPTTTAEGASEEKKEHTTASAEGAKEEEKKEQPLPRQYEDNYDGLSYTAIVEALEDQLGGVPEHGSRNQFIFTMACHLRYVCDHNAEWVAQVLPTYGEERTRWYSTILSACKRSQTKKFPKLLERALQIAEPPADDGEIGDGETPPPMPRRLPPLIKLLVSKTPSIYRPAVAHAVFPSLATHLWRTRFRYIDNVEHEATLMNVLMAGSGAGKSCISAPIDCIMADIRARDAVSIEKERKWKEEMNTKGANKDKKARPEGIIIQEVDADMTNAAFVMRLSESDEHFLYVKMNEVDQFDALKTSGKTKSQFQIMCLAFDPGNQYGQTRVGTQSVSARVCIRFNWNASTTVNKGRRYFRSVLTDGPISRINFCTIPEQPIGAPMPKYGVYDDAFKAELKPYIDRLNAARGLVDCQQITKLAKQLCEENATFSQLCQSRVYENLSFRATVIAFLKAMVLYVAQGETWDKTCEDFIRWSLRYDMWCKMRFFGDDIASEEGESTKNKKTPRSLLDLLPSVFTYEEAVAVRRKAGLKSEGTKNMLRVWRSRGFVDSADNQQYTKIDKTTKKRKGEG